MLSIDGLEEYLTTLWCPLIQSGPNLTDLSGLGHDVNLTGTLTNVPNKGVLLNNSTGAIGTYKSQLGRRLVGTLSIWFELISSASTGYFIRQRFSASDYAEFGINSAGRFFYTTSSGLAINDSMQTFSPGVRYNLILSVGSFGNRVYINGSRDLCSYGNGTAATQVFLATVTYPGTLTLGHIGAGASSINAYLGELAIFDCSINEVSARRLYSIGPLGLLSARNLLRRKRVGSASAATFNAALARHSNQLIYPNLVR
jgi:hypothetical protein